MRKLKNNFLIWVIYIALLFLLNGLPPVNASGTNIASKIHPQDFKVLNKIAQNAGIDVEKFRVVESQPSDFKRDKDGYLLHWSPNLKKRNIREYSLLQGIDVGDLCVLLNGKKRIIALEVGRTDFNNVKLIEGLKYLLTASLELNRIKVLDVENHKNLELLSVHANGIEKIEGLKNLPKLKILNLSNNRFQRFENVQNLPNLKKLDLGNTIISKIENMNFPELLYLKITPRNNPMLNKIEGLDKLKKLKKLYLIGQSIQKIENLDNLKRLELLMLSRNKISKLQNMEQLKNLKTLYIDDCSIEKIEGLEKLKALKILKLGDNKIKKIEGLDNLLHLREISLYGNSAISKIEGLENLKRLKTINLMMTSINKIEGLEYNLQLEDLYLDETKISKLENYEHLTKLCSLGFDDTPLAANKNSHKKDIQKIEEFTSKNRAEKRKKAKKL